MWIIKGTSYYQYLNNLIHLCVVCLVRLIYSLPRSYTSHKCTTCDYHNSCLLKLISRQSTKENFFDNTREREKERERGLSAKYNGPEHFFFYNC